jgi:predicted nucleic acid-binding protein
MILVDTGPLVALFNPQDAHHDECVARGAMASREALVTTLPVLTEVFYFLRPESRSSDALRAFIADGGLAVHFSDDGELARAFELMETYADHPMDLADGSVIAAAETLGTRKVFTLDRNDFETYRVKRGHRSYPVEIV